MFAYCGNNPINCVDPFGECPYNGTPADFHRFEYGLPSLDCTCEIGKTYDKTKIIKDTMNKKYDVQIDTETYAKMDQKQSKAYANTIASRIYYLSGYTISMSSKQITDFYQEAELHKIGYKYCFGSIKEHSIITDISILWDGTVFDGRFSIDYGKELIW